MTTKPVLLLDVDGVLNAVVKLRKFPDVWPKESWRCELINGFWIQWSTHVVDFINDISEQVDIRWHSTWSAQGNIDFITDALGLNQFPISEGRVSEGASQHWWKLFRAADVLLVEHRPLIWIDDDLSSQEVYSFHSMLNDYVFDDEMLLIRPKTNIGLTPEALKEIEKFIQRGT